MSAVVFAFLQLGCVHGRPFSNSSIDFNRGQQHRLVLKGHLDAIEEAVASVMAERHATLYRRRITDRNSTVLSFRVEQERRRGSRSQGGAFLVGRHALITDEATTDEYLKFGSLYYVEFARSGESVIIEALGLPVVDGYTSCPTVARARYIECNVFAAQSSQSFADTAEQDYGVSVNGARESEMISGLFAELQRSRWRDTYLPPPVAPRRAAPKVSPPDDVEDDDPADEEETNADSAQ